MPKNKIKEKIMGKVYFKNNIIKNLLKNVYFINGTAYAGKSTMVKMLAEKHGYKLFL